MATTKKVAKIAKVRIFEARVADGHGTETVSLAAASKSDARNSLNATLNESQVLKSVEFKGWVPLKAVPAEDESGAHFKSDDPKHNLNFKPGHCSQPYLQAHYAKETVDVLDYLRNQE
ncbi:hypothetical protein [Variovorax sp.]|jgi:hypothetical protein|uniref:hypothetical protein n=1 Tax=Variovorax sp. TaxID=1871043 RepID=UPI0025F42C1B|nr:hypothetical protein [Variovorax sp.]